MEKSEHVFVPEWSRTQTGCFSTISASNNKSSSNTDDHGNRPSSRHASSLSGNDHDISHSYSFTGRASSSSCNRSLSNGSTQARAYGSFGKSHRDRGQEKDVRHNERESLHLVSNGYCEHPDSFTAKMEKDISRKSQYSRRRPEVWPKKPGNDCLLSAGSSTNSISKKSFERDFPSLGTKEKQSSAFHSVASPNPISTGQSLPLGSSAIIGGNGWTSALVDVPTSTLSNGSRKQSTPASLPVTTPITSTGLNMAETLALAPTRARTPQFSVETQKLEELTIKQSRKLIPMTPSTPKASALSSLEKKPKGVRTVDVTVFSKVVPQSPSQSVNYNPRGPARSDAKASQIGNFQVLNRDRNGVSPSNKEVPCPTNVGKVLNLVNAAAPSAVSPKLRTDNKPNVASLTKSSSMEKKSPSQAQNRHEFFKTIRSSKSSDHSSAIQEQYSVTSCSKSAMAAHSAVQARSADSSNSDSSMETGNNLCGNCNGFNVLESSKNEQVSSCNDGIVDPDEEEVRFLRSLGWEENAGEDALTAEEIDAFKKKYMMICPLPEVGNPDFLAQAGPATSRT